MDNPHKGEVPLYINGTAYTLMFDWAALSKLKNAFNDEQIDAVINGRDVVLLAEMIAIGLQRHHEGITADEVVTLSPPLVPTVEALDKALTYAYFGPDNPAPKSDVAPSKEKKRRKKK